MTKTLRILVVLGFLSAVPVQAAIPVFYCTGCEKITKVMDLPDTDDFRLKDGTYVDVGWRYKQFQIMWIPIWNYGGEYAGWVGKKDTYVGLSSEELTGLTAQAGVTLPPSGNPPLWDRFGGKAILLIVIGLAIWGYSLRDEENKGDVQSAPPTGGPTPS